MANFPALANPQPSSFFSGVSLTSPIVDPMDFVNKPDLFNMLMATFPEQFTDLTWMVQSGMTKSSKVFATNPLWQENNRAFTAPTIASFSQTPGGATPGLPNAGNNAIRIVFAGGYSTDGTNSLPMLKQMIEFANGVQGYIFAKNTGTPNAHSIDVIPTYNVTQSYATFSSGLFPGMPFMLKEVVKTETGAVTAQTEIPTLSTFKTQIEMLERYFESTGAQMTNDGWIDLPGMKGKKFWNYALGQVYLKFFVLRELSALTSQPQTSDTDLPYALDGKTFRTTEGMIPAIENRGSQSLSWGSAVTIDLFEDLGRIALGNHSGNEFLNWSAQNLYFEIQKLMMAIGANGSVVYAQGEGTKTISVDFDTLHYGSYKFDNKLMKALSHKETTGIAGSRYQNYGVCLPKAAAVINTGYGEGNLTGELSMPYTMLYKEFSGETGGTIGRGNFMYAVTGGFAPQGATELNDNLKIGLMSHYASRLTRAREIVLLTK